MKRRKYVRRYWAWAQVTTSTLPSNSRLNNDFKKCGVFVLPSGISSFVENNPSSDIAWRSPPGHPFA